MSKTDAETTNRRTDGEPLGTAGRCDERLAPQRPGKRAAALAFLLLLAGLETAVAETTFRFATSTAEVEEGESVEVTVIRSGDLSFGDVLIETFDPARNPGVSPAEGGIDYPVLDDAPVRFQPGATEATFSVETFEDSEMEGNEQFGLVLFVSKFDTDVASTVSPSVLSVTILDDDGGACQPLPGESDCSVSMDVPTQATAEADQEVVLQVNLRGFIEEPVSVWWRTRSDSTSSDSARPGFDYTPDDGRVTFQPSPGEGTQSRSLRIAILEDEVPEDEMLFRVELVGVDGPAVIAQPRATTVVIEDDDDGPPSVFLDPGSRPNANGRWMMPLTCNPDGGPSSSHFLPVRVSRRSGLPVTVDIGNVVSCANGEYLGGGRCRLSFVEGSHAGKGGHGPQRIARPVVLSNPSQAVLGVPSEVHFLCRREDPDVDSGPGACLAVAFRIWLCSAGYLPVEECAALDRSSASTPAVGRQVTDPLATLRSFRNEVMAETPAGRYYTAMYESLSPPATRALFRRPQAVFGALEAHEEWVEAIGARLEGRGDEAAVTPLMMADLLAIVGELADEDPTLGAVADFELGRLGLGSLPAGATFDDFWSRIEENGGPAPCEADSATLCLGDGRFRLEVSWRDFEGNTGEGTAEPLTSDTGYFWFFDDANVELVVKVLDGRAVNDHFWVFYGALSNVEYTLTATDTETGVVRSFPNPAGRFASVGSTAAFPADPSELRNGAAAVEDSSVTKLAASVWNGLRDGLGRLLRSRLLGLGETRLSPRSVAGVELTNPAGQGTCVPGARTLCLTDSRFRLEVSWRDFEGNTGEGTAVPLTSDTGYFWFFDDANVELIVKVLDGRELNDYFWVFYGALSNVEYTLTVTDTVTGESESYFNPADEFASVGDTEALPGA